MYVVQSSSSSSFMILDTNAKTNLRFVLLFIQRKKRWFFSRFEPHTSTKEKGNQREANFSHENQNNQNGNPPKPTGQKKNKKKRDGIISHHTHSVSLTHVLQTRLQPRLFEESPRSDIIQEKYVFGKPWWEIQKARTCTKR